MLLQICVAMKAMPWYCALPTISEYMIENGWTKCFSRINDVGFPAYLIYLVINLVVVEFGIYWMHRELHDIKPLYKYLHATHHIYNKQNTLSPFAGKFLFFSTKLSDYMSRWKSVWLWMHVFVWYCFVWSISYFKYFSIVVKGIYLMLENHSISA